LNPGLKLAVGDIVVYRSHGAGPVTARESRVIHGKQQVVIVLALARGLRVELPLRRAHQLLRPLATESDISRVQEALSADQAPSRKTWLKRQRETLSSLNDGDPIGLAHIIRNSAHRQAASSPRGRKPPPSLWERQIATKARSLLSTEIAYARAIEPEEANGWIDRQLSRRP
jgi:RNA polymerase-interacting CarD/CdnL/TRCF family regulator